MLAKIQNRVLAIVMQLPAPVLAALFHSPPDKDGQVLDPHCRAMLRLIELSRQPGLEEAGVERGRRYMDARSPILSGPPRELARVEDRVLDTPVAQIPVRIYAPSTQGTLPALLYFHGGGFVLGSITSHDRLCRIIADEARCVVINVEYRRAPDHKFPAAADDALAAFRWVRDHAAELGVNASKIAVGGDSAGGNLAAGVCLRCVASGEQAPSFQWLVYPVTDLANESRSYKMFDEGYYLTRASMKWFAACYVGDDNAMGDPLASPLLAPSVEGVAPAWVMTAGFDPLRDEGAAYANRLSDAGVSVKHDNYPALFHGVFNMTGMIPAARKALTDGIDVLRRHFQS